MKWKLIRYLGYYVIIKTESESFCVSTDTYTYILKGKVMEIIHKEEEKTATKDEELSR